MSGLAGARGLVTACRIHHEDKVWDEPRGLLVRESSVTFGESCARMATATPQSLPRAIPPVGLHRALHPMTSAS
jgi:hypothetical protein